MNLCPGLSEVDRISIGQREQANTDNNTNSLPMQKSWNRSPFALVLLLSLLILSSCENRRIRIAETTSDSRKGIAAVKKLKDEETLAHIVYRANDSLVARAAAEKLTDQVLLFGIASMDSSARTGRENAYRYADEKLSHPSILQLVAAFDSVPKGRSYFLRSAITPAIRILMDPDVISVVGEIAAVSVFWDAREAPYFWSNGLTSTLRGELFHFMIELRNGTCLSETWQTIWPETTSASGTDLGFLSCEISLGNFIKPVLDVLSPGVLEKIAWSDDPTIREIIFRKLGWVNEFGEWQKH
jgi:hypothetical protein